MVDIIADAVLALVVVVMLAFLSPLPSALVVVAIRPHLCQVLPCIAHPLEGWFFALACPFVLESLEAFA